VRENFSLNVNVILVGPFTRELMAGKFFHPTKLGLPASTTCRIAWIDLDSEVARQRIEHRADARDAYKLAHWETYLQRRVEPPVHHHLYRFNNLEPSEAEFQALLAHLIN
jgi:hypothetical protein